MGDLEKITAGDYVDGVLCGLFSCAPFSRIRKDAGITAYQNRDSPLFNHGLEDGRAAAIACYSVAILGSLVLGKIAYSMYGN